MISATITSRTPTRATRVAAEPALKGTPLGFFGISQAGWVTPHAATRSQPAFMALWSAPVCTIREELHFSAVAEHDPTYLATHSAEQIREADEASQRMEVLIDDAIGYTLRGYYQPELDSLRGRGLERRDTRAEDRRHGGDRRDADPSPGGEAEP